VAAVIGDIRGKCPIIVDDMITTGGTIRKAGGTLGRGSGRSQGRVGGAHGGLAGGAGYLFPHRAHFGILGTRTLPARPPGRPPPPPVGGVSGAALLQPLSLGWPTGGPLSALSLREGPPPI